MANLHLSKDDDENIKTKYSSKDVGLCLFSDNMYNIERVELIGDIFRLFALNEDTSNEFIKKLDEYKKKGAFFNLIKIDNLGYEKDYIDFLYECKENSSLIGTLSFREGILDKGYLDKTNNICYSKDLKPSVELTLINKDFKFPIICRGKKLYRGLGYNQSKFINNITLKDNSLILGLDLGYLFFRHRNEKLKIYVYEEDKEYALFFKDNILANMTHSLEITFLDNLEDIDSINPSQIILDNTLFFENLFKMFYELKLYKYLSILESDSTKIILNKLKSDYRNIVLNDKEEFCNSIIENYKEFKGIECSISSFEIDFAEKCERFLDENKIYYESYKKFQKNLNNDEFFINILKNY